MLCFSIDEYLIVQPLCMAKLRMKKEVREKLVDGGLSNCNIFSASRYSIVKFYFLLVGVALGMIRV